MGVFKFRGIELYRILVFSSRRERLRILKVIGGVFNHYVIGQQIPQALPQKKSILFSGTRFFSTNHSKCYVSDRWTKLKTIPNWDPIHTTTTVICFKKISIRDAGISAYFRDRLLWNVHLFLIESHLSFYFISYVIKIYNITPYFIEF